MKLSGDGDNAVYGDTSRSTALFTIKVPKDYDGVMVAILKRGSNAVAVSLEELAECLPDGQDTTPDTAAAAFVGEVINAFVAGLPKRERVLFVRRYFYLDSVRQAAGYAQMTEGNAKTTLYRLRQSLKKALQKEGLL